MNNNESTFYHEWYELAHIQTPSQNTIRKEHLLRVKILRTQIDDIENQIETRFKDIPENERIKNVMYLRMQFELFKLFTLLNIYENGE